MKYYGGVDPGKDGGVAVLREDGELVGLWDMDEWRGFSGLAAMTAEAQHAFPKINATTNFKMGLAAGFWRGWCEALGVSLTEVAASKWQREVCGSLPKDRKARKKAICEWAERRWPGSEFRGPKGGIKDGRSDAACIAEYGRRQMVANAAEEQLDG